MGAVFIMWVTKYSYILIVCFSATSGLEAGSQESLPSQGQQFIPSDVEFESPVYESSFDDKSVLKDWVLEGGRRMKVVKGSLILESRRVSLNSQMERDNLVCWLKREVPADFLLEFTVRPENHKRGLNIVFFNTRGVNGEDIFSASLHPRDGTFDLYH